MATMEGLRPFMGVWFFSVRSLGFGVWGLGFRVLRALGVLGGLEGSGLRFGVFRARGIGRFRGLMV